MRNFVRGTVRIGLVAAALTALIAEDALARGGGGGRGGGMRGGGSRSMQSMGVNKKFFDGLSKADQLMLEAAALRANDMIYAEYNARNGEALTKLVNEQGVKLRKFSDEMYDAFGEASNEVYAEIEAYDDLAKRCLGSYLKARKSLGGWTKLADQSYLEQRNRVIGV